MSTFLILVALLVDGLLLLSKIPMYEIFGKTLQFWALALIFGLLFVALVFREVRRESR